MAILVFNTETNTAVERADFGDESPNSNIIVTFDSVKDAEKAVAILNKKDEIAVKAAIRIEKETSRLGFWDRTEFPIGETLSR